MKTILFLVFCIGLASAGQVTFTDCGHGEATDVTVSGCSGDYCIIYRGKSLQFAGDFVANQDTATAEISIFALVNNTKMPFPGVESDGCNHIPGGCPLVKGKRYHFEYNFITPSLLPKLKASLHAELVGDKGPIACVIIKGEVQQSFL